RDVEVRPVAALAHADESLPIAALAMDPKKCDVDPGVRAVRELRTDGGRERSHRGLDPLVRASTALMLFTNDFSRRPLPTVPSTNARNLPFAFLPSRTITTSTSAEPLPAWGHVYV